MSKRVEIDIMAYSSRDITQRAPDQSARFLKVPSVDKYRRVSDENGFWIADI